MEEKKSLEAQGRDAAERLRLRRDTMAETARTVYTLAATAQETRRSIEAIYMTPAERLRVAASLTGIGVAAASLVTGAPVYLVAPRLANNLLTLIRAGRRVKATSVGVPLRLALEEILA